MDDGGRGPWSRDDAAWSAHDERERLMASCPARAAALVDEERRAPRPPGVAGEVLSRRRLGLRGDEGYVRGLHAAFAAAGPAAARSAAVGGGGGGWSSTWGFLMTEEEERSLWDRQHALRPLAEAATALLADLPPPQVGGAWKELGANGVVVALTAAADVRTVLAELRARARPGQQVRAVRVRWSTAELQVISDVVLERIGECWSAHGIDVMNGAVSIMVPDDVEAVRRAVAEVVDPCAVYVHQGRNVLLPAFRRDDPERP